MKVTFVGAGPGKTDLITVRGMKAVENCDVLIYAGSLVSEEFLELTKEGAEHYNSASMSLEEVCEVYKKCKEENKDVVRLHTGDPSIYGAIREQIDELKKLGIEYSVIPGVSSFTAAAASIGAEFTLPDVSQSVILTRMKGRTPVPEKEEIKKLASINASMAIFLSAQAIDELVKDLIEGYGSDDIPVCVVYRASWDDEKVVRGTLKDIADLVKKAGITRQAQILVGRFLGDEYSKSKLYDEKFSHGYRNAR